MLTNHDTIIGTIRTGFDFAALPPSSVIVDVGGGVGSVAQLLVRKYKDGEFKVVVQDREEVCEEGVRVSLVACVRALWTLIDGLVLLPFFYFRDGKRRTQMRWTAGKCRSKVRNMFLDQLS